jgi:hypothetical protein
MTVVISVIIITFNISIIIITNNIADASAVVQVDSVAFVEHSVESTYSADTTFRGQGPWPENNWPATCCVSTAEARREVWKNFMVEEGEGEGERLRAPDHRTGVSSEHRVSSSDYSPGGHWKRRLTLSYSSQAPLIGTEPGPRGEEAGGHARTDLARARPTPSSSLADSSLPFPSLQMRLVDPL